MPQNLFQQLNLPEKKRRMAELIEKATEIGWLKAEDRDNYISKLQNDILTIGVIGQMKAGKSTFLNSFVFGDTVLPAATTPMTAALSVVTWGEKEQIEAEFYTSEEWQEQLATAQINSEEIGDEAKKAKIQAAQELVEKSKQLGSALNGLLGKKQTDTLTNLIDYVGANGRYVSITKQVTIYCPLDYLRGVRIVDTPGFNDPIVSREERTKEFLKQADVVLLMLYAGQPFSAVDRNILFKHVGGCGIGKVLIGINKYDIPYGSGESEEQIRAYVKSEIAKAAQTMGDEQLNDILRDTEPIPLSAEMALVSQLPMSRVQSSDVYKKAWERAQENFEVTSPQELRQRSHIDELIEAIRQMIEREKSAILFRKPLNAILALGNNLKTDIEEQILKTKNEIELLQAPDEELEECESQLERINRRMNRKIDSMGDDLNEVFQEIVRRGSNDMEDAVDSCCSKMHSIVDAWGRFASGEKLVADLERCEKFLYTRTLKRIADGVNSQAKLKVKHTLDEFFVDAEDILCKIEIDDFDPRDFVKGVSKKFDFSSSDSLFSFTDDDETDTEYGLWEFAGDFLNGFTFGLTGVIGNAISHGDMAAKVHSIINDAAADFDAKAFLGTIIDCKDKIISEVQEAFIDELLTPLKEQLDEIRHQTTDKAQRLEASQTRLSDLLKQKENLVKQIKEMNENATFI